MLYEEEIAMILAAGRGIRMKSLTDNTPKPLVKITGEPILLKTLKKLDEAKIKKCVVNTNYLSHKIKNFINHHNSLKKTPKIFESKEEERLETGGGIKAALNLLPKKRFLVINGDCIILDGPSGNPINNLLKFYKNNSMDILLLLNSREKCIGYNGIGDFKLLTNRPPYRIDRNLRNNEEAFVFTGWQILHPRIFSKIKTKKFSLNILYDNAIREKKIYAIMHDGYWLHIGTPEDKLKAQTFLKKLVMET